MAMDKGMLQASIQYLAASSCERRGEVIAVAGQFYAFANRSSRRRPTPGRPANASMDYLPMISSDEAQVRRIMARVGFKVRGLKRTKIGNIGIKGLAVGGSRKLTKSQISYLRKVTGL